MSQSINLGNTTAVNFNGTALSSVKLNNISIWEGAQSFTSAHVNGLDGKLVLDTMGWTMIPRPHPNGGGVVVQGSTTADRTVGLPAGVTVEGIYISETGGVSPGLYVNIAGWYSTTTTPFSNFQFRGLYNFTPTAAAGGTNVNLSVEYYAPGKARYYWRLHDIPTAGIIAYNGWNNTAAVWPNAKADSGSLIEYKFS